VSHINLSSPISDPEFLKMEVARIFLAQSISTRFLARFSVPFSLMSSTSPLHPFISSATSSNLRCLLYIDCPRLIADENQLSRKS